MRNLIFFVACLIFSSPTLAQHDSKSKKLDGMIKEGIKDWKIPGLAAVIVKDGEIISKSHNLNREEHNPIRHAEIIAIEKASSLLKNERLTGCELYVTKEPCAMCAGAIYWSEIGAIVYGCSAKILGEIAGGRFVVPCRELLANGEREIKVIGPLLEAEGAEIHRGFW